MRSIPPLSGTESEINHSDPPCTALRSGEHDSSTAYTMIENFVHLLESKKFDEVVKHENVVKPIGMLLSCSISKNTI